MSKRTLVECDVCGKEVTTSVKIQKVSLIHGIKVSDIKVSVEFYCDGYTNNIDICEDCAAQAIRKLLD